MVAKVCAFTAILLLTGSNLFGQFQWGFSVGVNTANAKETFNDKTRLHSFLARLNAGADFAHYYDEHWGIQTGIYYAGKGWRERYNLGFDTVVTKLNYIEVPLKAAYRLRETNQRSFVFTGGVYGSYGISGKTIFRGNPDQTRDPFERGNYKRFDLGYVIESAYYVKEQFGAKLAYSHALLNLLRPDDMKLKNYLFNFSFFVIINRK
jgi:hypothetical protein